MLLGIAKLMPMLPPVPERIAVFTPRSWPLMADERAARVAGIDRRVGLDEVFVALDVDAAAAEGAHDARRRRLTEAERIADRNT